MDERPDPVEETSERLAHIAPERDRRATWRLAALAGVLAVLLAALVIVAKPNKAVARVQLQVSAHAHPAELNYVIGAAPEGFAPGAAKGAGEPAAQYIESEGVMPQPYELFGTADDPAKPTLWVSTDNRWEEYPSLASYVDISRFSMNGRSGMCAHFVAAYDLGIGPRRIMCWLDRSTDAVMVQGIGLNLETVKAALARVITLNGAPHLPKDAVPAGMALAEKGTRTSLPQYPVASAGYTGACGTFLGLTVGWADEVDLAGMHQESREWTRVEVGASTGFLSVNPMNAEATLAWIADGKAFTLNTIGYVDLPTVARSVRPATAAEWSTFGHMASPTATMPTLDPTAVVVEETVVQVPTVVSADEATLLARSRFGDTQPLMVRRSGPQVHIVAPDGFQVWKCAPPSVTSIELTGSTVVGGVEQATGVVAVSPDVGAWQMEVQAVDGTRYVTRFARLLGEFPNSNPRPVYVAYVSLPKSMVASAVVKDSLGKVIVTK